MSIYRLPAEADTTITNAYKEGLVNRGTKANMGIADSLEVFVLAGQAAAVGDASQEVARILLRFNMTALRQSLVDGELPNPGASNKPKYILRLFNAPHPESLPQNFNLSVHALNKAFEEGTGLDMSEYSDEGAASWLYANSTEPAAGTGTITVVTNPTGNFTVTIDGQALSVTAAGSKGATRDAIKTVLDASSTKVNTANNGDFGITITAKTLGASTNYVYSIATDTGQINTASHYMTGGLDFGVWSTAMNVDVGDYTSPAIASQTFSSGNEDLLLDITSHIESVIWDGSLRTLNQMQTSHKGFIIKISTENTTSTLYTKKFFARSSEFFFKRPCVEARWSSSESDNRSNFHAESKLLTNAQNTQYCYLYNSIGGTRSNYTFPAGEELYVRFYTDPDCTELAKIKDMNDGYASADFVAATNPSTGVYKAGLTLDTTGSYVYDKWYSAATGNADKTTWTVVHTSKIKVKQRSLATSEKNDRYIFNITNLKNSYSITEKPRFRVYTRLKDWSPTIYTVARRSLQNEIIDNVYFKIFRVVDDEVLFDYGRGTSTTNNDHTKLSYDAEGSYFDFDMSLLQAGYMYGIRLLTSINGVITEQEEIFKFRID